MKKFWTPTKIVIIVIFSILALCVPFMINELYMTNNGYITIWGAEDVFLFWGDCIGAGATILAVVYTIMYTEYSRKKERDNACQPYLSTEFKIWEPDDLEQKQWNYDYAIEVGKEVEFGGYIGFPDIIHNIRLGQTKEEKKENLDLKLISAKARLKGLKDLFIIDYDMKNMGLGTCINTEIIINQNKVMLPFSLSPNLSKRFLLVCDLEKLEVNEEWELKIELQYNNIYKNKRYIQAESFMISRTDNEMKTLRIAKKPEQTLSAPKEIKL